MTRVSMPSQTGDQGQGHPVLFGFSPAEVYAPHPDGGGYPIGFLDRAYMTLGVTDPTKVLHLCSGSMRIGVRVDIRPEMQPDIVADCRSVPLPDESFDWVMADPPYSEEYARNLYGTEADYPKPGQILREAARLLRPGGRVGLLHFQVPMPSPAASHGRRLGRVHRSGLCHPGVDRVRESSGQHLGGPSMTDTLAHIEAVLDFAEGPWKPERDRDGDGLRRQRYFIWLTNDAGDSLQIDEGSAVLLANTYPEALAVVRAALDIAEGKFIDTDGETLDEWCHWCESMTLATHLDWCPWPALRSSVAAYLAKAQDATEAGS